MLPLQVIQNCSIIKRKRIQLYVHMLKEDLLIMYIENTDLENITADLQLVSRIMRKNGLECSGAWDYERITFDRRFDVREGTFYLRVFAIAKSGEIDPDAGDAVISLLKPALGKYYYPHGVEYDNEVFPAHLVKKCEETLASVKKELVQFEIHA